MPAKQDTNAPEYIRRWRLVLGKYAEQQLDPKSLDGKDKRMDKALGYLYDRELHNRGMRSKGRGLLGSLDPTQLTPLRWLGEVRSLFPASVCEVVQSHALDRYEITGLLKDPKTLDALEPNRDLLKALITLKGRASPEVQDKIRQIAKTVVEDIIRRLKPRVTSALSGAPNRYRRSQFKAMQNFNWRATIRENLKNYDPERGAIIAERLHFFSRMQRRLPWTIILCIDQSGSMTNSVIYSAVMAAILSGLPSVRLHLIVFDTSVVDLSEQASDPVDVLMSVQLGGGTDIGQAVSYCEGLIAQPSRTVLVLVSDFCEGASPARLISAVKRLSEARVKMMGLAALDDTATSYYDRDIAQKLVAAGMPVGIMTPDRLADWMGGIMR